MEETKLYGAHIKFPKVAGDIEFKCSAMEITKIHPTMIETKHYYFTRSNYSTRYFEERMLDKEFEITDALTVFYSKDKQKCIDWLNKRRNELLQSYKYNYERLKKSEVKEVCDYDE